jgi:hypothetical protein
LAGEPIFTNDPVRRHHQIQAIPFSGGFAAARSAPGRALRSQRAERPPESFENTSQTEQITSFWR